MRFTFALLCCIAIRFLPPGYQGCCRQTNVERSTRSRSSNCEARKRPAYIPVSCKNRSMCTSLESSSRAYTISEHTCICSSFVRYEDDADRLLSVIGDFRRRRRRRGLVPITILSLPSFHHPLPFLHHGLHSIRSHTQHRQHPSGSYAHCIWWN